MRSQAPTNRTGREVAQGERDERRPFVQPREGPAQVLALQRAAGNRVVADWLLATGGPVLARRLPDDPTELGDYATVRQQIRFDNDVVDLGDLDQYFLGARAAPRTGLTIGTHFSGAMAAGTATQADEAAVRDWLANIGMTLFNLHDTATDPLVTGVTRIETLDLSAHSGQSGRYRFTSVVRARARGAPSEVDLLVELVGPARAAAVSWDQMPEPDRQALLARFAGFGFVQGSAINAWSDNDFGKVLQALGQIPDAVLASVRDMTFERGSGALSVDGEAGHYAFRTPPPVRTLTLYGDAFGSDDQLRFVVAHEIGHALSGRPQEANRRQRERSASRNYRRAAQRDGGLAAGITEYARTSWDEHYAEAYAMFTSEPDTLLALRPHIHAYFVTLTDGL